MKESMTRFISWLWMKDWTVRSNQFGFRRISGGVLLWSLLLSGRAAQAQIVPDSTLGSERSTIVPRASGGDAIAGGAIRGLNLFHSFSDFNINDGQRIYFANPTGIQTILTRVTGKNASNINGTLGVDGTATLFLINPNGILFGSKARLDVSGSFVASTADAIKLGETGLFSATDPAPRPLLSIDPSALLFTRQIPAAIETRSRSDGNGLQVPFDKSLILAGGEVRIAGGIVSTPGGRIELGGLSEAGSLALATDGNALGLTFPAGVARSDVFLSDRAAVNAAGMFGGSVVVHARNLTLSDGSILGTGALSKLDFLNVRAGDVSIDVTDTTKLDNSSAIFNGVYANSFGDSGDVLITTGSLFLGGFSHINTGTYGRGNAGQIYLTAGSLFMTGSSYVDASTYSQGNGGQINIQVANQLSLKDSIILSNVGTNAIGQGGTVNIKAGSIVGAGSQVDASTYGQGDAGKVMLQADRISFEGQNPDGYPSGVQSNVEATGIGNSGGIQITANSLSVQNGAQLLSTVSGEGNAGNIDIQVGNLFTISNSLLFNTVEEGAFGNGGTINIKAGSFSGEDGAIVSASTSGFGDAGDINFQVANQLKLKDSVIASNVESDAFVGNGGNINIKAGSIVGEGSQINAATRSLGDSGKVTLQADNITFKGNNPEGRPSGINSSVDSTAIGNGGGIQISTNTLLLSEGAKFNTSTAGYGDAGNIDIQVKDLLSMSFTSIRSSVETDSAIGNGGAINIKAGSIVASGGQINTSTQGRGDAGKVTLQADSISFEDILLELSNSDDLEVYASGVNTSVLQTGVGNSGGIQITANNLLLNSGAQLNSSTFGRGDAGNIDLQIANQLSLTTSSYIFSNVQSETAIGNGGAVNIRAGSIVGQGSSQINTFTRGRGNAGKVTLQADTITFQGSTLDGFTFDEPNFEGFVFENPITQIPPTGVNSTVLPTGIGNGGGIQIIANTLSLRNGAQLSSATAGQGTAGRIDIQAERVDLDESAVSVSSTGAGQTGDLLIQAGKTVRLDNQAQVIAQTRSGNGGNITVQSGGSVVLRRGSQISTTAGTAQAQGNGGNITIDTIALVAVPLENSSITARAFTGKGGNIQINAQAIYGFQTDSTQPNLSAINASSQLGIDGNVTLNTPEVDPSRSAIELPTVPIPGNQIAQLCPRGNSNRSLEAFVVSGRGSAPPNPMNALTGTAALSPLATLDSSSTNRSRANSTSTALEGEATVLEAQGWIKTPDGKVILVAHTPKTLPPNLAACPHPVGSEVDRKVK